MKKSIFSKEELFMNFVDSVKCALKNYRTFRGRASRSEFWYFLLFDFSVLFILVFINKFIYGESNEFNLLKFLISIIFIALILPSITVTVRRLHDINKSGWWIFLQIIPLIGPLIIYVLCALPSTNGTNKYGNKP
jgi:uncharacterized membrane protein YhaH (DUF805 family)